MWTLLCRVEPSRMSDAGGIYGMYSSLWLVVLRLEGLYVTQELLTGIKVRFLAWKAKVNNTNPVSMRTELSPSHCMSRERYLATAN